MYVYILAVPYTANSLAHFKSVFFQDDIYMYGGKIDATGNVSSQLWVFHIPTQTWAQAMPKAKEQYAVVGHSAHIVTLRDGSTVMLVIFGHCPLYGYISNVQEYNLGELGPTYRSASGFTAGVKLIELIHIHIAKQRQIRSSPSVCIYKIFNPTCSVGIARSVSRQPRASSFVQPLRSQRQWRDKAR